MITTCSVYTLSLVCMFSGLTICYWIANWCTVFLGKTVSQTLGIRPSPFQSANRHFLVAFVKSTCSYLRWARPASLLKRYNNLKEQRLKKKNQKNVLTHQQQKGKSPHWSLAPALFPPVSRWQGMGVSEGESEFPCGLVVVKTQAVKGYCLPSVS